MNRNTLLVLSVLFVVLVSLSLFTWYLFSPKGQQQLSIPLFPTHSISPTSVFSFHSDLTLLSSDKNNVYLTDSITGEVQTISLDNSLPFTVPFGNLDQYHGVFSPDKASFLFLHDHNIWKYTLADRSVRQLTTIGRDSTEQVWGIDAEFPKWALDGKHIYYSVTTFFPKNMVVHPGITAPSDIQQGTWLMDEDGNNQIYLPEISNPLAWTPDSKQIIFSALPYDGSTRAYDLQMRKVIAYINGKSLKQIFFSNDGSIIVYTTSDLSVSYMMDKNFQLIGSLVHRQDNAVFSVFPVSPDGKYVLITKLASQSILPANNAQVLLWDTSSRGRIVLPITVSPDTKLFWSRDSKRIIYVKEITGKWDVYSYDLATRVETKVTTSGAYSDSDVDY